MEVINKNKVLLIVGIVFMLLLFLGGTFAYFTVGTTNNFGSKTIIGKLGTLGSVTLNSGSNLKIDLTAADMMQMEFFDQAYYASSAGTTETPTEETIATAQVVGAGIFQCNYKLKVEEDSTNSMYTALQNMSTKSANQIILTVNGKKYDFNTANLFPLTIDGTFTNLVEGTNQEIKVGLTIINKGTVNQTDLAGTDLLLNFNIEEFNCTVTDEEVLPTKYWNDNFSRSGIYKFPDTPSITYASVDELQTGYGPENFASHPAYIKTTDKHQVCIYYNNKEFCMGTNYWVSGDTDGSKTTAKLKAGMGSALGVTVDACESSSYNAVCGVSNDVSNLTCWVNSADSVMCDGNGVACVVNGDGSAECH